MTLRAVLLISLGAVLGANARYAVSTLVAARWGVTFPWGTLLINVSGSFLIGLLMAVIVARFEGSPGARALLVTGFLGSYTTFSAYAYETVQLGQRDAYLPALSYALGSVALGVGAAVLGLTLGNWLAG